MSNTSSSPRPAPNSLGKSVLRSYQLTHTQCCNSSSYSLATAVVALGTEGVYVIIYSYVRLCLHPLQFVWLYGSHSVLSNGSLKALSVICGQMMYYFARFFREDRPLIKGMVSVAVAM